MRYTKARPIGEILRETFREEGLETPLLQHRLIHTAWPQVIGEQMAAHTHNLRIFNDVLYMEVDTPTLRQEILFQRTELVKKLNAFVDSYIIHDIRLS